MLPVPVVEKGNSHNLVAFYLYRYIDSFFVFCFILFYFTFYFILFRFIL
jgi:hypothetical protein